jgi:1,4-alpha-glucan branching enzyme
MSIGAVFDPLRGGTTFTTWAPDASGVAVRLRPATGAAWSAPVALARAGDGQWQGFVGAARRGSEYVFELDDGHGATEDKLDPAARDTLHSSLLPGPNAGIVVDPSWSWADFQTPGFADLIIYQLHVGAFSGRNDHCRTWPARFPDVQTKLDYVRGMGFNAIELLPVQEFCLDRSWGYNPAFFFAPESAYGTPSELRQLVDEAHKRGLAVLFDVVFNHAAREDNSLWGWDVLPDRGLYLQDLETPWGNAPAYWKDEVKDFFLANAEMYFSEYRADGLRFDATRAIEAAHGWNADGWRFLQHLTWCLKQIFPGKYLVAEHLPDHDTIIESAGFHATWHADAHHELQRAAGGDDPVTRLMRIIGKGMGYGHNYPAQWNLVRSMLGSHDDCGDLDGGKTLAKPNDADRHRYFVELFGGRGNGYARAKARLGWALNVAAMGTPMLFMGSECHMWGYWHDSEDENGDHRFDWSIAGDPLGMEMRRLVTAANQVRWSNPCLRGEHLAVTHVDHANSILAFKRWIPGRPGTVLVVVNCGDRSFGDRQYGVATGGQAGQWTQILCTQDAEFGGCDGPGNAYYEPFTQPDGKVYLNVPQWSVVMMRLV